MSDQRSDFAWAKSYVDHGIWRLEMARASYADADLSTDVKRARLAAIDAKIDALSAVHINDQAHPWVEDGVL